MAEKTGMEIYMKYQEVLVWATQKLTDADIEDARLDAWYLLEHVTGFERAVFISRQTEEMPEKQLCCYQELIEKRSSHIPLQQLTRYQEFMGLSFFINEHVLIPRQDTELLVEYAGAVCKGQKVLDLCTGSGCIILSLVKLYGVKEAVAVDISEPALVVAKKNGELLGADVKWLEGDLFEPVSGTFNVIVSNPPYIERAEIDSLMPEVREHEPLVALDGGTDGLYFYRRIIRDAAAYLSDGGYIFLEIGSQQARDVETLLFAQGYSDIQTKQDYSGHDRLVYARFFRQGTPQQRD